MALRDSKLFRAVAYTLFGLSLASFVFAVVMRVLNGHGADIYHGGRGLPIPNIAALVMIVAIALVLVVWLFQLAWRKWRHPQIRRHGKRMHDTGSGVASGQPLTVEKEPRWPR